MSTATPRDTHLLKHALLRLGLHANHTRESHLAPSGSNQSLSHNLSVLWHLGMYGDGSAQNPMDVDDDDENPVQSLSIHHAPPLPHWHVSTQMHCLNAVLNYLPPNENVVLSPFSLISCMAMLCRGATEGLARDQLAYYCWPCLADGAACDDSVALVALSTFVNQLKDVKACKYANILMTDHANVQ